MTTQRRTFLQTVALSAAGLAIPSGRLSSAPSVSTKFGFGIASYTFRAFTLDQLIAAAKRLGVQRLTLKDMHLPLTSTQAEIDAVRAKIAAAGLELSSCGVVYMKTEREVEAGFTYARSVGLKMLVGVPDAPLLPVAERFVKQFNIELAIHNHGPNDQRYPSPESAYELVKNLDRRMGLCIDVGHTQRLGLDPSKEIERFYDRVYDVHIKDVSASSAEGTTVEMGRGVIDLPRLLRTLVDRGYDRTVHFEFEKDKDDPLAGVAESVGYVRGILSAMSSKS
jgi:sugar phosphate isomerase/epimerase